jgi:hypothetical protein
VHNDGGGARVPRRDLRHSGGTLGRNQLPSDKTSRLRSTEGPDPCRSYYKSQIIAEADLGRIGPLTACD